jgi:hypothetical protein
MFPHQNPVHTSPFPHTCYMPSPSQSSRYLHYTRLNLYSLVVAPKTNNLTVAHQRHARASVLPGTGTY